MRGNVSNFTKKRKKLCVELSSCQYQRSMVGISINHLRQRTGNPAAKNVRPRQAAAQELERHGRRSSADFFPECCRRDNFITERPAASHQAGRRGGRGKNVTRRVDKEEDRNNDGECKFQVISPPSLSS